MPPGLDRAAAVAGEEHWQFVMIMAIAVPDSAAVNNHAIIQQRPLPFAG